MAVGLEQRLGELPPEAGVLFVSVSALPEPGGVPKAFAVRLGIERKFAPEFGTALVRHYLGEELTSGSYEIRTEIFRGRAGRAARADGEARSDQA